MLRFQAEARATLEGHAAPARARSVEGIPGVELEAGLGGPDFQGQAAPGLLDAGREAQWRHAAGRRRRSQDEVVVVAAGDAELFVTRLVHAGADARRRAEIEGRARHGPQLAGRDERGVHRREAVGGNRHHVVEYVTARARQVEVGVVGQVDHGGPVGFGFVAERKGAVAGESVPHAHPQGSGESLVAIGAGVRQRQRRPVPRRLGAPNRLVEAPRPAVQGVRRLVDRHLVRPPVQLEPAAGDAVGAAADRRAHEGVAAGPVLQAVVAQHHLHRRPVAVRDAQGKEPGAMGADAGRHAAAVVQDESLGFRAARQAGGADPLDGACHARPPSRPPGATPRARFRMRPVRDGV